LAIDDVLAAIRTMVARHEGLRTLFQPVGTSVLQKVQGSGTLPVDIAEMEPADVDVEARTAELCAALSGAEIDVASEWAIRVTLLTRCRAVERILLYLSHVAVDCWAAELIIAELEELLAARPSNPRRDSPPIPQPALQPIDLAAEEQSDSGRSMEERAAAFQREILWRAPQSMLVDVYEPNGPDLVAQAEISACDVDAAAADIAQRCRISANIVIMAGFATIIGYRSGLTACTLRTNFANRVTGRDKSLISRLAAEIILCLDISEPSFESLARKAFSQAMRGYARARYDPIRLAGLVDDLNQDRGIQLDLSILHNDGVLNEGDFLAANAARAQPSAGLPGLPRTKLYFHVNAGGAEKKHRLYADTRYLRHDEVGNMLLDLRDLLWAVSRTAEAPMADLCRGLRTSPVARGEDWMVIAESWTHLGRMEAALIALDRVADARVLLDHRTGGRPSLVACVVPRSPEVTAAEVHAAYRRATADDCAVVAPDRLLVCRSSPVATEYVGAWEEACVSYVEGRPAYLNSSARREEL
jgi:hypothetical protein